MSGSRTITMLQHGVRWRHLQALAHLYGEGTQQCSLRLCVL